MLFVITFPCLFLALSAATASTPASERAYTAMCTRPLCLFIVRNLNIPNGRGSPGVFQWMKLYLECWAG
ncbi:hypothetical protein CLOHYLEM_06593 [[Clostridium] hylemonae DSM 15053]|uniref:Secreted protein n=1 Tax=[Clostridium] hylemonae DSM 15053 TaxID=553973 RepID=C0C3D2_9FIRM|nr:hypothetical protein CLOHYLEM_06593 [[Clostridium] hylemonae DSM 15053]